MSDLVKNYIAFYLSLPLRVRDVIRDLAAGAVLAFTTFNFVAPHSISDLKAQLIALSFAVGFAVLGVARRELWPLLRDWALGAVAAK